MLDLIWNGVGNATGINDAINGFMSGLMTIIVVPSIIYGIANCLFGYKIFRIVLAIIGFLFGCIPGWLLGYIMGGSEVAVLMCFAMGAIFAYLAHKLYKLGVFISVTLTSSFILSISLMLLTKSVSSGLITFSVILGVIIGIIAVILDKAIIIIYTAISGAIMAGNALAIITVPELAIVYDILLSVLGIWYQNKSENNALRLQSVQKSVPAPDSSTNITVNRHVENIADSVREATINVISSGYNVLVSDKAMRWTEGMPMLVNELQIASAKDEQVVFNMLVQNISEHQITGIYFDIKCYNPLKQQLESVENKAFLDLRINSGENWSSKNFVTLPDNTTRKCVVTIRNIVFDNEDIWTNENLEELKVIELNNDLDIDYELVEEFHNQAIEKVGINGARAIYTYKPLKTDEYWCCACGQFNLSDNCVKCGISKEQLFDIFDAEKLKQEITERQIAIEQKKELARKQREQFVSEAKQKSKDALDYTKSACNTFMGRAKDVYDDIKEKVKANPKKAAISGSVSAVVIVGVIVFVAVFTSETSRLNRALKNDDYSKAYDIYYQSEKKEKLDGIIIEFADEIYTQFENDEIDFDEAEVKISGIHNHFWSNIYELQDIYSNMYILNDSKVMFENGMEYLEDKDYSTAFYCLSMVSEIDPNYNKAQSEMKNAQNDYVEFIKSSVDELMENNDYLASFELISTAKEQIGDDVKALNELETGLINQQENERIQAEMEVYNRPYEQAIEYITDKVNMGHSLSSETDRKGYGNEVIYSNVFEDKNGKPIMLTVWSDDDKLQFETHILSDEVGFQLVNSDSFQGTLHTGFDYDLNRLLTLVSEYNPDEYGTSEKHTFYGATYSLDECVSFSYNKVYSPAGGSAWYFTDDTEITPEEYEKGLELFFDVLDTNVISECSTDNFEYVVKVNSQKSVDDTLDYLRSKLKTMP